MNYGPYGKAVLAVLVSAVAALVTALGPGNENLGDLSVQTWLVAGGSILASGGMVWLVENIHGVAGGIAKAAQAFLTAGFASLVVGFDDGVITQGEWMTAFAAAVVATGFVYQAAGPITVLTRTTRV